MRSAAAASIAATMSVVADHVDRYREQVGELLAAVHVDDDAELARAIEEAERTLRVAERAVRRVVVVAR